MMLRMDVAVRCRALGTALNDALRAAILEGTPLAHQSARLLLLCLWGVLSYLVALRWFRWT
jgi:hypothetical protein